MDVRVFDWDRASRLIVESGTSRASAGLKNDWADTSGDIFLDGNPVPADETYTYLASMWDIPQLNLDGSNKIACFKMQSETCWDSRTYWPSSAIAILNGKK